MLVPPELYEIVGGFTKDGFEVIKAEQSNYNASIIIFLSNDIGAKPVDGSGVTIHL